MGPYRTAPEKPVKVTIQLTDEELAQAIRDYCFEHKSMEIPKELTSFEVNATIYSPKPYDKPVVSSIKYNFSTPLVSK